MQPQNHSTEIKHDNSVKVYRVLELDALRGVAILLVIGRHILDIPATTPSILRTVFVGWRELGWIGVDLFFVLSGFLVSGLLFKEFLSTGTVQLGRFLIRRGFKIYPSFYVFLTITGVAAHYFAFPIPFSRAAFLGELLFLQNYTTAFWNHTWSLAVEEHFYLLLSFLVFVLFLVNRERNNPFHFVPKLIIAVNLTILSLRALISIRFPIGEWEHILPLTHFRIDSLFAGVLISYYFHFKREQLNRHVLRYKPIFLPLIIVTVFLPIYFPLSNSRFMYTLGFTALYLAFSALLLLSLSPQSKLPEKPGPVVCALSSIGRDSYSIYLWHMFVYLLIARLWPTTDLTAPYFFLRTSLYILGSIFLGVTIARIIERPFLNIRDRYFPSISTHPPGFAS